MAELPPQLVVRAYAPARRWFTVGAIAIAILSALYAMFEVGRYNAGYDSLEALRERSRLTEQLAQRDAALDELHGKLAHLETADIGQSRERLEVQRTIGELQAQVASLSQELAFYRGIVTQGANASEVKVQNLSIAAADEPNTFHVRLTLVQPVRPDAVVSGNVTLAVLGQQAGKSERLDFAALTGGKRREVPFTFRYLENIDEEIVLPADLKPEELQIEVRSSRRGVAPLQQSLVWNVEAS
ncbi:MAG: hypothetical protein KDI32_09515 [Pseudomonadales bacterium]|nr:hypothetical protein [Pseudomonadales bacterium]